MEKNRGSIWGPGALYGHAIVLWRNKHTCSLSWPAKSICFTFKLNSIIKSMGLSETEVCQDHIPLLQISVNNPTPMPKLEISQCVVTELANPDGGTRIFTWFQSQLIDQCPVSLLKQNLKQNQNKLIKSSRNFE